MNATGEEKQMMNFGYQLPVKVFQVSLSFRLIYSENFRSIHMASKKRQPKKRHFCRNRFASKKNR